MQLLSSKKYVRCLFPYSRDAKELAIRCGIPVVPGYEGKDQSTPCLMDAISRLGYPVLLKASMGGGGRVPYIGVV